VDPVHRSTVDRSRGVRLLLIWVVRADRTTPIACRRGRRGSGRPAPATAAELAGGGPNGAPGLGFERGKALREEGKEGKLTRGSEGREKLRWRRSSGGSGSGAPAPAGTVLCTRREQARERCDWRGSRGCLILVGGGREEGDRGGGGSSTDRPLMAAAAARDRAAPMEVGRDVGARESAKGRPQGL
jgi:hypothetical protein